MRNGRSNYFVENTTRKFFYDLLETIDEGYWMVTWSACDNEKYYENEVYHALNHDNYLVNVRAPIKDDRSYLKYQGKKAKERAEKIKMLFNTSNLQNTQIK